jgi:hypothetical protein
MRSRRIALAALAATGASLLAAAPADAGGYVVSQCSAANPGAEATFERSIAHYRGRSRCGTADGLQVFHDAAESGLWHYGAWVWRAPAGTVFTSVQANASLVNHAGHRAQLVATRPDGSTVEFGSEHGEFRVHSVAGEFAQFHGWLRCVAPGPGRPCGRAGDDAGHAYLRGVFLRLEDRAAPTVGLRGGSLLAEPVVRGVRGLVFDATDAGAGVRTVSAQANGSVLALDARNCALAGGFATALRPCPAATTESVAVPTTGPAFATGPNTVAACAEDLALDGLAGRTCERRSVWVDNACPGSAVGAAALDAGFGGKPSATVRSSRGAVVSGRAAGAGAGATVCALTRIRVAGSPVLVAATAATETGGRYAIELPPGPSRDVFVHLAFGDRVVARHGLALRSVVRPAFAVRPRRRVANRDRLRFAGTLPGPACGGRLVKVQARLGKRRWQVFRTGRTDAGCAFSAGYELRATSAARRYRFRAVVPAQAGYPYERGRSRIARVRVAGSR